MDSLEKAIELLKYPPLLVLLVVVILIYCFQLKPDICNNVPVVHSTKIKKKQNQKQEFDFDSYETTINSIKQIPKEVRGFERKARGVVGSSSDYKGGIKYNDL